MHVAVRSGPGTSKASRSGRTGVVGATGASVMGAIEHVIDRAYELGALASYDAALTFYAARGWQTWQGTASVIAPGGVRSTPDDEGAICVRPVSAELDLSGDLACGWRGGDVW